jgi:hypothetical protein
MPLPSLFGSSGVVRRTFERRPILAGALLMFALLAVVYTASIGIRASRGASITGDEPFYLLTTQSLIDDGDLDLTEQYERKSYREFFDHPDGLWRQSVPNDDGVLLSPHNPGLSVYVIPGFLIGGLRGAQVQLLLTAALTFALTYVLAARISGSPLWSWAATAAVGLSATAFIYSTEIYPEIPAACALVLALLVVTKQRSLGWGQALLLTLALSALVWFGVKYAVLAVPVTAVFLWRADNVGRAVLVGAGGASAAAFAGFHISVFGEITPYSVNSVYEGSGTGRVLDSHFTLYIDRVYRIWGVFIDRRFGLARWAPVLLLAIPGMLLLARRGLDGALIVSLVGLQLLVATFVAITMMGWWFPGRTMATVLPLFAIPMTLVLVQGGRAVRILFGALAAYSLLVTLLLARAGHLEQITAAVDPWEMPALPFEALAPLFPQYTSWGSETQALNATWLTIALLLLAGYAGWRVWEGPSKPTLPQWISRSDSPQKATPARTTPQA